MVGGCVFEYLIRSIHTYSKLTAPSFVLWAPGKVYTDILYIECKYIHNIYNIT